MNKYDNYKKVFDKYNGVITTAQFLEAGYHHKYLKELMDKDIIRKIKRGYYEWQYDEFVSDTTIITSLFPDAVIYLLSALYIHGYTDRTPNEWHLAVARGGSRSRFEIKYPKVKPCYIHERYMKIGKNKYIYEGKEINIFDKDRTICDVVRNANKMDKEIVNQAIKGYISDPQKNTSKLLEYAKKMRAENKVRNLIGVWL